MRPHRDRRVPAGRMLALEGGMEREQEHDLGRPALRHVAPKIWTKFSPGDGALRNALNVRATLSGDGVALAPFRYRRGFDSEGGGEGFLCVKYLDSSV